MRPVWQIEFESSDFLPRLPENAQMNQGTYGFELALWLAEQLSSRRISVCYPQGEDWGWFVDTFDDDGETMIACSNIGEEGSGYTGNAVTWSISVKAHRSSLKQTLRGEWPIAAFARVTRAILEALVQKGIAVRPVKPL